MRQFKELGELPNISIFPKDVLLDLFDWLPIGSVVACQEVCRDWYHFVALARRLLYLDPKYPNGTIPLIPTSPQALYDDKSFWNLENVSGMVI